MTWAGLYLLLPRLNDAAFAGVHARQPHPSAANGQRSSSLRGNAHPPRSHAQRWPSGASGYSASAPCLQPYQSSPSASSGARELRTVHKQKNESAGRLLSCPDATLTGAVIGKGRSRSIASRSSSAVTAARASTITCVSTGRRVAPSNAALVRCVVEGSMDVGRRQSRMRAACWVCSDVGGVARRRLGAQCDQSGSDLRRVATKASLWPENRV